jgi:hypothetical protein
VQIVFGKSRENLLYTPARNSPESLQTICYRETPYIIFDQVAMFYMLE